MSLPVVLGCAAAGALAGAMVPRVAYRVSVDRGAPPRAGCAACATPFVAGCSGWLRAGDRCPCCRAPLGPPVWLTAALGAVVAGALGWSLDPTMSDGGRPTAAGWLVLAAFLAAGVAGVLLAAIDVACLRLPDAIVGSVLAVALGLLGAAAAAGGDVAPLLRALAAAFVLAGGYLVLALLPGANLGMGDVKLCVLLGLLLGWLGWGAVLLGALLPHLINAPVVLGALVARRVGRKTQLPFGPALLAGALLAVVGYGVARRQYL